VGTGSALKRTLPELATEQKEYSAASCLKHKPKSILKKPSSRGEAAADLAAIHFAVADKPQDKSAEITLKPGGKSEIVFQAIHTFPQPNEQTDITEDYGLNVIPAGI
jgi:hypothetical protein